MRDAMGYSLPVEIRPRQAMFDATPELLEKGEWVCLNIDPTITWPVRAQSLLFTSHRVWIIPTTVEDHPGVAIRRPASMSRDEAEALLHRFLSVLSWRENMGFAVVYRTGGNLPRMMGLNRKGGFSTRSEFDFTEVISPDDEPAQIALALMREARSLNHYGYAFLSYWRVLELAYPQPAARVSWMTAALLNLGGRGVQEALDGISASGITDVGSYLFSSGRCAIAHATGQPIVNPDDPRDALRLYRELPIVRELASRAIEEQFGIDTPSTEFAKHLYELRGWKRILGEEIVAQLNEPSTPLPDQTVDLPAVRICLRDCPPYLPLEKMVPKMVEQTQAGLLMIYASEDGLAEICFYLSFSEERLIFDVFNGIYGNDDGSIKAAVYRRDVRRFFRDYLLNGSLQIWNADTGDLISRLDEYMPVNMMVDLEACNASVAEAQLDIDQRSAG